MGTPKSEFRDNTVTRRNTEVIFRPFRGGEGAVQRGPWAGNSTACSWSNPSIVERGVSDDGTVARTGGYMHVRRAMAGQDDAQNCASDRSGLRDTVRSALPAAHHQVRPGRRSSSLTKLGRRAARTRFLGVQMGRTGSSAPTSKNGPIGLEPERSRLKRRTINVVNAAAIHASRMPPRTPQLCQPIARPSRPPNFTSPAPARLGRPAR
jgi:hypothetical protein